jgi:GT2 family glycosyltransferase
MEITDKISVLLCTKDREEDLCNILGELLDQTIIPDEIVIVDSSSPRLTRSKIFLEKISHIRSQHISVNYEHMKPGLTKQRNKGVSLATGDLLFFLDDDSVPARNYIEEMAKIFKNKSNFDGGMGQIKPVNFNFFKYCYHHFFLLRHNFGDGGYYSSGSPRSPHGTDEFKRTKILSGGSMVYRKEVFANVDFDENLTGYSYMEDVDVSYRISRNHKLFYNPNAEVIHEHDEPKSEILKRKKMYIYNFRYLFDKNFYSKNKGNIFSHWWAVLGFILKGAIKLSPRAVCGAILGIFEYELKR